jgi:rubredoxin
MLQFRKVTKKPKSELVKLENKLWDIFSIYIRLRDSDSQGVCKCFTCGALKHWTKGDAGHGIPRQHKATKFNEINNNFQCKKCNGFEGGMREAYEKAMDKKYGAGTWNKMLVSSKQTMHFSVPLLQNNIDYYTEQVRILKESKGMI